VDSKTCFKCGVTKDMDEFYRHSAMKDGHLNKCKECTKLDVQANYRDNWDHYVAYERYRELLPIRREQQAAAAAKARQRHPSKYKARTAVGNAVRDGRLLKGPCEKCGTTQLVQAHHHDYSKPLDIRWLCRPCHMNDHGKWSAERVVAGGEPF